MADNYVDLSDQIIMSTCQLYMSTCQINHYVDLSDENVELPCVVVPQNDKKEFNRYCQIVRERS